MSVSLRHSAPEGAVLDIPGRPIAWARAGSHGTRRYTPARVRAYEERVAWQVRAERVRFGDQRVVVEIELHSPHELRGDVDNYAKAVLDGLQKGGAIENDRQVVDLRVSMHGGPGVVERTLVRISALEEAA